MILASINDLHAAENWTGENRVELDGLPMDRSQRSKKKDSVHRLFLPSYEDSPQDVGDQISKVAVSSDKWVVSQLCSTDAAL